MADCFAVATNGGLFCSCHKWQIVLQLPSVLGPFILGLLCHKRCCLSDPLLQELPDDAAGALADTRQLDSGFGLGRFGWGLVRSAAKASVRVVGTLAIVALADKQVCHMAKDKQQLATFSHIW